MALFVIAGRNFRSKERREQGRDAMQRHHSLPGAWATLAQQQPRAAVEQGTSEGLCCKKKADLVE
jgi:hypothetical protein